MDYLKEIASFYAYNYLLEVIRDSNTIGLGTGSTIKYFIKHLVKNNLLTGKTIVVSSLDTLLYLANIGLHASIPTNIDSIDVYVDGFDEMDNNLNLVKGRGAALHWEKQLALRSNYRVYIGDYTKVNGRDYLYMKPVPIEVSKPALPYVVKTLSRDYRVTIRYGKGKDGPVITDTGNFIIDIYPDKIIDPEKTDLEIRSINGVVETGIFPRKLVDTVIVSFPNNYIRVYEA